MTRRKGKAHKLPHGRQPAGPDGTLASEMRTVRVDDETRRGIKRLADWQSDALGRRVPQWKILQWLVSRELRLQG